MKSGSGISPTENILSDEILSMEKRPKVRNYSFKHSKRLPIDKMTEINGVKIPSMPGSCYHAILVALAENKDTFCPWDKIIELTQSNIRKYGGAKAWKEFTQKPGVKTYQQRIRDNAHTLTRTGRDCYGYRLHEQGMCIYYFKDGAMLVTGGKFVQKEDKYDVVFSDGRKLQKRYRGTTMTYKEYKTFLEQRFITPSGVIMNNDGIRKTRALASLSTKVTVDEDISVCVELGENFDQSTAIRLEKLGFKVEQAIGNEILGTISRDKLELLKKDKDVEQVEVSGD